MCTIYLIHNIIIYIHEPNPLKNVYKFDNVLSTSLKSDIITKRFSLHIITAPQVLLKKGRTNIRNTKPLGNRISY